MTTNDSDGEIDPSWWAAVEPAEWERPEVISLRLAALASEAEPGTRRGEVPVAPADEDAARRQLLEIFAETDTQPAPADTIRTLVHTLSHLLLRGLDDGQVGFAEASLAEWMVPETLTFAVYANSLKDFTLGSLWTLLNNRSLSWLRSVCDQTVHCENDPICYQRAHRSCERCAYLTFGCRHFNADLDRRILADYLLARGVLAGARTVGA